MMDIQEFERRSNQWLGKYSSLKDQEEKFQRELEIIKEELSSSKGSVSLIQYIVSETSKQNEQRTADLATLALKETFPSQNLSLKVEHTNLRNTPGVEFSLVDDIENIKGDPLESFGGGPASLLSIILRVIAIMRQPGMERILILDEPMAQVSKKYGPLAGKLLRRFCEPSPQGLGFKMLVVTHMQSIADAAHKRYHAEKLNGSLQLRDIDPEEEIYE